MRWGAFMVDGLGCARFANAIQDSTSLNRRGRIFPDLRSFKPKAVDGIGRLSEMGAKKKLIITGAHGFVAGSVLTQAGSDWEVHAISRSQETVRRDSWHWHVCDPLARAALTQVFRDVHPYAVIHTAAQADVGFCKAYNELSGAVIVHFACYIVVIC